MSLLRMLLVVVAVLFPVLLSAQPRWVDEGGPYGGTVVEIVKYSGGFMAAPSYRPYVLFGSADGKDWAMRTMPDVGAMVFRLLEIEGRLIAGGYGRAYLSDDGGQGWREIRIDWDNTSAVTALIGHNGKIYAANGAYLYVSTNNGLSWSRVDSAPLVRALCSIGDALIAGGRDGVSRSMDDGLTWEALNQHPPLVTKIASNFNGTLLLSVEKTTGFSAPPAIVYRSTDSGRAWQSSNLSDQAVQDLTFGDGTWYASTLDGLFSSIDDGASWEAAEHIGPYPRAVHGLEAHEGELLAGVAGSGIWKGEADNGDWAYVSHGAFPIGVAQIEPVTEGMYALSLKENQLYFRAENSSTWEMRHYPLTEKPGGFLLDDGQLYLSTTGGVLTSTDAGARWSLQNSGFAGSEICQAITRGGQSVIVGLRGSGVALSNNCGLSWHRNATPQAINWYHFLTVGTTLYAATEAGLLISTDDGESWLPEYSTGFPYDVCRISPWKDGIVAASLRGAHMYNVGSKKWNAVYPGPVYAIAATGKGVFAVTRDDRVIHFSPDLTSWKPFNDGLPNAGFVPPSVCRIELKEINGRLYIGACSLPGLFSLDLSTITSTDISPDLPEGMRITSTFPAPAMGHISIEWSNTQGGHSRLELLDVLGRSVRLIAEGMHEAGRHSAVLDAAGLPDGAYLCRLSSGGRQASRVIILR